MTSVNNTNKKREFFDLGLYKESLRRIKLPTVIFFVIITLTAVLVPVSHVVSANQYINTQYFSAESISAFQANPLLILSIIVVAPVLTYTLFSFLNKRNASDFYCSLPHTRLALYTSRVAALVTSIAAIILVTSGISALMLSIFPEYLAPVWSSFFKYMAGCFAASLLVCAVFAIAMSITGTVLNNILVAGLIMFLPRTVLTIIIFSVTLKFPLIVGGYISDLLSPRINILTGFYDVFLGSNYTHSLLEPTSQIYTLFLAIVYFVIGGVLFCRRKSESAERAAPTHFMQSVYRMLLTMVVCLLPCAAIFISENINSYDVFTIVCFYIVALIVYLFYELITTRKWKNLAKCLPGLVVVVILNFALIGTMHGIYKAEVSFTPDAEDVEYVSLIQNGNVLTTEFYQYAISQSSDIKITDPDAIRAVTETLQDNVDYYLEHGELDRYYSSFYVSDEGKKASYIDCTVKIKSGLTTKYRRIYMKGEEYEALESVLTKCEEYTDLWMNLPGAKHGTVYVNSSFTDDESYELYETMKDELKSISFTEWNKYLSEYKGRLGSLQLTVDGSRLNIPFSQEILPETTSKYVELVNSHSPVTADEIKNYLETGGEAEKYELNISDITLCLGNGSEYSMSDSFMSQTKANKFVLKAMVPGGKIDITKCFFKVTMSAYIPTDGEVEYRTFTMFVPATDDAYEIAKDMSSILK